MRIPASIAAIPLLVAVIACPGDKKQAAAPALPDTTAADLESLTVAIPPAVVDTFTPPRPKGPARPRRVEIPDAPPALVEAVRREQAFSKFCYEEFGQKHDPALAGGVAMIVTVDATGISDARVEDDSWSSPAGKAVNSCLNDRAKQAWRLASGTVRPGRYVVQLSFRPS